VSGRFRPSAESKRAGEGAVLLETLVVRDRKTLDEALPLVQKVDASMTRAAAEALLARFPARAQRAQLVALDDRVHEQEIDPETVEERALARERAAVAETTSAVVRDALATLSADDRVMLGLRFGKGMRVAAIARAWQCNQQILYRRLETIVRRLRQRLTTAGIDAATAAQLIGVEDSRLEFGWRDSGKFEAVQTIPVQGDRGNEESAP
jgi:RNA polymerase sigma factor (sigma-70 family)